MVTFKQRKRDRKLEWRSNLAVEFPQKNNRVFRTLIPFLENPSITESGRSNLNEYELIGRAGSLFSYGSSPSRELQLSFKINLLHMLHMDYFERIDAKFKRTFGAFFADEERDKKAFQLGPAGQEAIKDRAAELGARLARREGLSFQTELEEQGEANAAKLASSFEKVDEERTEGFDANPKGKDHANIHRSYFRGLVGQVIGSTPAFDGFANSLIAGIDKFPNIIGDDKLETIPSSQEAKAYLDDLIDLIYVWLNLIRGTTLNNSRDTTLGPPIVRLTHGPMYNNVPCVVENYSINIIEEAGYDVETLTPKSIQVSMSLREFRSGNFGEFSEGRVEYGDNLAGWEAIIDNNNIDPYNGEIGKDNYQVESTNALLGRVRS